MYYNHLSRKERYQIFVLLQAGKNKKEIAHVKTPNLVHNLRRKLSCLF
ncbi:helix-turn-helix domain-containing protein [Gilliamella sp. Imp1-1]|nr:helix-turn-helix domain-containing protein [Gilliamella apicola]